VAAQNGHADALRLLLAAAPALADQVDEQQTRPLRYCARFGHAAAAQVLLGAGASCTHAAAPSNHTYVHEAARQGHAEVVSVLLAAGALADAPDASGLRALHFAACAGCFFFESGYSGFLLMYVSTRYWGHAPVIAVLLAHGASVAPSSASGSSPLHAATRQGHTAAATLLMDASPSVDARNKHGDTPLYYACRHDRPAIARALLARSADPVRRVVVFQCCPFTLFNFSARKNAATWRGDTPLHCLARRHNSALVRLLLDAGANPNVANGSGRTPLHFAA
jgi:ankyrin repeat protein